MQQFALEPTLNLTALSGEGLHASGQRIEVLPKVTDDLLHGPNPSPTPAPGDRLRTLPPSRTSSSSRSSSPADALGVRPVPRLLPKVEKFARARAALVRYALTVRRAFRSARKATAIVKAMAWASRGGTAFAICRYAEVRVPTNSKS